MGASRLTILAVSGSLQAASSNTAVLRVARDLAPDGVDVVLGEPVDALPHFNPDLDRDPVPDSVTRWRRALADADGVLIASPEYAHEMPGSLKNALDWIVGSGELYEKPVAIVCASPRPEGGVNVRAALERTLGAQGSIIVTSVTVPVATSLDSDASMAADPGIARAIEDALGELADRPAAPPG